MNPSQRDVDMQRNPAMRTAWRWAPALAAVVLSCSAPLARGADQPVIADKTLVVWTTPDNLAQRGGSALTIERPGGVFDAVVFGELAPSKWMAGSEGFRRTRQEQEAFPTETADQRTLVQIALVYSGNQITLFRNGVPYADYTAAGAETFDSESLVLMGLRHRDANRDKVNNERVRVGDVLVIP